MASLSLTLDGAERMTTVLRNMVREIPDVVAAAMQSELEVEATESQRRTPVDTGALRASHQVSVEAKPGEVVGTITVGGVAAPYALYVHENLDAYHPVGQAKFLESTLVESTPHLASRIGKRINLNRLVG